MASWAGAIGLDWQPAYPHGGGGRFHVWVGFYFFPHVEKRWNVGIKQPWSVEGKAQCNDDNGKRALCTRLIGEKNVNTITTIMLERHEAHTFSDLGAAATTSVFHHAFTLCLLHIILFETSFWTPLWGVLDITQCTNYRAINYCQCNTIVLIGSIRLSLTINLLAIRAVFDTARLSVFEIQFQKQSVFQNNASR